MTDVSKLPFLLPSKKKRMTFESWNEPPNKSHQNIRAWKMQIQILEGKTLELDRDYVKFEKTCQTENDWST